MGNTFDDIFKPCDRLKCYKKYTIYNYYIIDDDDNNNNNNNNNAHILRKC